MKSILLTLRHEFTCFPCRVSSFWWSRFCWPRGTNLFLTVLFVVESMSLDPEARICFLQCTSFSGVDLFDPEAPVYFLQWITLWHLDSGLIGFFVFAASTLTFFCVCTKSSSFPVEWFPASKRSWTETKHSPAWALAKMVLIWPQESCFSPVVAGVCGLPFKWHDPGLPQWFLQIRNPGFQQPSKTEYHLPALSLFLFLDFWLLLTLPITVHY